MRGGKRIIPDTPLQMLKRYKATIQIDRMQIQRICADSNDNTPRIKQNRTTHETVLLVFNDFGQRTTANNQLQPNNSTSTSSLFGITCAKKCSNIRRIIRFKHCYKFTDLIFFSAPRKMTQFIHRTIKVDPFDSRIIHYFNELESIVIWPKKIPVK